MEWKALGTRLMYFMFVFQEPWSEKHNILRQHVHKKEFWILTIKCGTNSKHNLVPRAMPVRRQGRH